MGKSQEGVRMLGYFVCFLIGVLIAYLYFLNTNGSLLMNRDLLKEELVQQKTKIAKLEMEQKDHAEIIQAQTSRSIEIKSRLDKIDAVVRDYDDSADQLHKDYLYINAYVAKIERQYASLTPVHLHFKKDHPTPEFQSDRKRKTNRASVASI